MDETDWAWHGLSQSFEEALFDLYLYDKKPPYRVPHRMDGDLYHFKTTRSWNQAKEWIKQAVEQCVLKVKNSQKQGASG